MAKLPAAVLFDCDGVLVDSEVLTNRLMRDDLAAHGLDLTLEQMMALAVGGTIAGVADKARGLGARLPDDWVPRLYDKMFAALEQEVEAVPGAVDLVARLAGAGVAMAVASNGPRAKMQITLTRTGLMGRLAPHVYSAQDVPHPKPAPDVYLLAAAQLRQPPEHCVVIEDSAAGAQAGKAAGMRCIGFAAMGQAADLAPHCDSIAKDMAEVAQALGL